MSILCEHNNMKLSWWRSSEEVGGGRKEKGKVYTMNIWEDQYKQKRIY